jgi:phosphonopyruvate decarboxylase
MISCQEFYQSLKNNGVDFFCGVPDSLLQDICAYITDHADRRHNIITANEGNAIALAAGHYLAEQQFGLVYMQNSGLGNAVNPLTSLTDQAVYSIPVLLLIGWRGEPGKKDAPQHVKQGQITPQLLETLDISYDILADNIDEAEQAVKKACAHLRSKHSPYALIVRRGTFEKYCSQRQPQNNYQVSREAAIKLVIENMEVERSLVVATTGKISRELFEQRARSGQGHQADFLTVGSMGHASSIALGIALKKPDKQVYCLDGDGAALMHLGSLATVAAAAPANYKHIILNNGCHDSVGGQPTVGFAVDFLEIARSSGYQGAERAETVAEIENQMKWLQAASGPALLEIRVSRGARHDLGRPTKKPVEIKQAFMEQLKQ